MHRFYNLLFPKAEPAEPPAMAINDESRKEVRKRTPTPLSFELMRQTEIFIEETLCRFPRDAPSLPTRLTSYINRPSGFHSSPRCSIIRQCIFGIGYCRIDPGGDTTATTPSHRGNDAGASVHNNTRQTRR